MNQSLMAMSKAEAERRAMRSLAQEGIELTEAELAERQLVVSGEISEQEYRDRVIADIKARASAGAQTAEDVDAA